MHHEPVPEGEVEPPQHPLAGHRHHDPQGGGRDGDDARLSGPEWPTEVGAAIGAVTGVLTGGGTAARGLWTRGVGGRGGSGGGTEGRGRWGALAPAAPVGNWRTR